MGRPKEWLPFGGETLLQRIVRLIEPMVDEIVLAASAGQELPPVGENVLRVDDTVAGCGPMQGLLSGLRAARQRNCEAVLAAAVDLPLLQPSLVARMLSLLGTADDAIAAIHADHRQPLPAVYRTSIIPMVEQLLSERAYALQGLLDRVPMRWLTPQDYMDIDPDGFSFLRMNTPADYQRALQLIAGDTSG